MRLITENSPLLSGEVKVYTEMQMQIDFGGLVSLGSTATVGEIIGWNIREARRARKWTQPEFGIELGKVLPKPWPAQTVSSAEKGERAFAAAELAAVAHLLQVPISALFLTPGPIREVTVTETLTVEAWQLDKTNLGAGDDDLLVQVEDAREAVRQIEYIREEIEERTELIKRQTDDLFEKLGEIGAADAVRARDLGPNQRDIPLFPWRVEEEGADNA